MWHKVTQPVSALAAVDAECQQCSTWLRAQRSAHTCKAQVGFQSSVLWAQQAPGLCFLSRTWVYHSFLTGTLKTHCCSVSLQTLVPSRAWEGRQWFFTVSFVCPVEDGTGSRLPSVPCPALTTETVQLENNCSSEYITYCFLKMLMPGRKALRQHLASAELGDRAPR